MISDPVTYIDIAILYGLLIGGIFLFHKFMRD